MTSGGNNSNYVPENQPNECSVDIKGKGQ